MKTPLFFVAILLPFLGAVGAVHAEKADRDKPMNIEADSLRYDDAKQISVFTGRVHVRKGTIQIHGQAMEVRQDPAGNQFGRVTGSEGALAFFRQKRDGVEEYIEGEGETIEYDGKADTVKFVKNAQLRRLRGTAVGDEVSGGVILYENLTDVFRVDGVVGAGSSGRVRAMLVPKSADTASTPAAGAVAVPVLQAAQRLPALPK